MTTTTMQLMMMMRLLCWYTKLCYLGTLQFSSVRQRTQSWEDVVAAAAATDDDDDNNSLLLYDFAQAMKCYNDRRFSTCSRFLFYYYLLYVFFCSSFWKC